MVGVSSILLQISGMDFLVSRTYLPVAGEIQFLQVLVHNSFHFRCKWGVVWSCLPLPPPLRNFCSEVKRIQIALV
jgi:hypothetical protein